MPKIARFGDYSIFQWYHKILRYAVSDWEKYELAYLGDDKKKIAQYRFANAAIFRCHLDNCISYFAEAALRALGIKNRDSNTGCFICVIAVAIMATHDVAKWVGVDASYDGADLENLMSYWTKPGKLTEEEYETMKKHVDPIYRAFMWRERFGIDPDSVPPIIEIIGRSHHQYMCANANGYPKEPLVYNESPLIRLLAGIAKCVDEADAAMSELRSYKEPIKPSKFTAELQEHMKALRIPEASVDVFRSMMIDNGGLSNNENIISMPIIQRIIWDRRDKIRDLRYPEPENYKEAFGKLEETAAKVLGL